MDDNKTSAKEPQGKGSAPQTTEWRDNRSKKEATYKTEPGFKNISGIMNDCHKVADMFLIVEFPCPIPREVE